MDATNDDQWFDKVMMHWHVHDVQQDSMTGEQSQHAEEHDTGGEPPVFIQVNVA